MRVKKYNGKLQDFDKYKIEYSITAAANEAQEEIPEFKVKRLANTIEEDLIKEKIDKITTDDLSNRVENLLMSSKYKNTARQYITYHFERQKEHIYNSDLIKLFKKKLKGGMNDRENANNDELSFSGKMGEAANVMFKDDALRHMSSKSRNNHNNNEIYIHDLNSYSAAEHNCLSIPFDELFKKSLVTKQTGIRPPKHIQTALQLVAVIIQVQSLQQFGGVSATHLDWTMIPFVRNTFYRNYRNGLKYMLTNRQYKNITGDTNDISIPLNETQINKVLKVYNITNNTSIDSKSYKNIENIYKFALDLTEKETMQGAEGLIHNLNSLQSRSGAQLPFSSINYGTCTLPEGRMVTNAILDATLDGTGPLHETPIFPCGIFQYEKGINDKQGTPNYDLYKKALKCTAKRFYPNYCNVNWSINEDAIKLDRQIKRNVIKELPKDKYNMLRSWIKSNSEDAKKYSLYISDSNDIEVSDIAMPFEKNSTMGCRTYNGADANFDENYFNYIISLILANKEIPDGHLYSAAQKDGRGNICPSTIILPTIAMESKGELGNKNIDSFLSKLDKKIYECRDGLIERFTVIASQQPSSAPFMYMNRTMFGYIPEQGIISALKHGTVVIGQLGLAETLQILIGKDQTTPEGMELAKKIEALFNKRCKEFKQSTYEILGQYIHLNFGVYYTPAESLCYTALKKFRDKYGIIPNISDKEFFTNSMHVPVWHNITPFEKIDIESQLTGYSNGGCITYVELEGAAYNNIKALEKIVNYAMEHDIPYFALNPKVDSCNNCGYSGEIDDTCPKCGSNSIKRLRRVTGYITNDYLMAFNDGKIDEVRHRETHIGEIKAI